MNEQSTQSIPEPSDSWLTPARATVVLVLLGWVCYANSLTKTFILDDFIWIAANPLLDWPWEYIRSWRSRWFSGVTILLSYWTGGRAVVGFHLMNVAIHLAASLVLFGLVRRTLLLPRWNGRFVDVATVLAFFIAALWMVHPLQTQSVTYIIQRCESLMGLCYLLTLYLFLRGATAASGGRGWYLGAIATCFLGMGSKEVMITAPVVVASYDWVFLSGSIREKLRQRWWVYGGLALAWATVASTLLAALSPGRSGSTVGMSYQGVSALQYAKTQPGVILYYLRLSVWPAPLCLDYRDWPVATAWSDWLPQTAIILALLAGTAVGLVRRTWWGFLGVWFFGILSVTSSFLPIADLAFEHRMYLPLAAVVAVIVMGGYLASNRLLSVAGRMSMRASAGAACVAIAILGLLTVLRNQDYSDRERMWRDVIAKRPGNARGHSNLGAILLDTGRLNEAIPAFRQALALQPGDPMAHNHLGVIRVKQGRLAEGLKHFEASIKIRPQTAVAHHHLGLVHLRQGRLDQAAVSLREAVRLEPRRGGYRFALAFVLAEQGNQTEAAEESARARQLEHNWLRRAEREAWQLLGQAPPVPAHDLQWALLLARQARQASEAPDANLLYVLALAEAANGHADRAVAVAREALVLAQEQGDADLAEQLRRRFRL
jgi:tetratricopeptide (TPR) repeat protein